MKNFELEDKLAKKGAQLSELDSLQKDLIQQFDVTTRENEEMESKMQEANRHAQRLENEVMHLRQEIALRENERDELSLVRQLNEEMSSKIKELQAKSDSLSKIADAHGAIEAHCMENLSKLSSGVDDEGNMCVQFLESTAKVRGSVLPNLFACLDHVKIHLVGSQSALDEEMKILQQTKNERAMERKFLHEEIHNLRSALLGALPTFTMPSSAGIGSQPTDFMGSISGKFDSPIGALHKKVSLLRKENHDLRQRYSQLQSNDGGEGQNASEKKQRDLLEFAQNAAEESERICFMIDRSVVKIRARCKDASILSILSDKSSKCTERDEGADHLLEEASRDAFPVRRKTINGIRFLAALAMEGCHKHLLAEELQATLNEYKALETKNSKLFDRVECIKASLKSEFENERRISEQEVTFLRSQLAEKAKSLEGAHRHKLEAETASTENDAKFRIVQLEHEKLSKKALLLAEENAKLNSRLVELECTESKNAALQKRCSELLGELSSTRDQKMVCEKEHSLIKSEKVSAERKLEDLKRLIHSLQKINKSQSRHRHHIIKRFREEKRSWKSKISMDIAALSDKYTTIKSRCNALQESLNDAERVKVLLQSKVIHLNDELKSLKATAGMTGGGAYYRRQVEKLTHEKIALKQKLMAVMKREDEKLSSSLGNYVPTLDNHTNSRISENSAHNVSDSRELDGSMEVSAENSLMSDSQWAHDIFEIKNYIETDDDAQMSDSIDGSFSQSRIDEYKNAAKNAFHALRKKK